MVSHPFTGVYRLPVQFIKLLYFIIMFYDFLFFFCHFCSECARCAVLIGNSRINRTCHAFFIIKIAAFCDFGANKDPTLSFPCQF